MTSVGGAAAVPTGPRTIVVVGAVGGCGATTIALHLARARARHERTCFVEAAARAGAAERLGLDRAAVRTWPPRERSPDELERAALPLEAGFRALLAPPDATADEELITSLPGRFDVVVVDDPSGRIDLAGAVRVVVSSPTEPSARRARAVPVARSRRAVVLNRTGPGGEATRASLERTLGARIALELPCCPSLRDAEDAGRLLSRPSRWLSRLERLASAIAAAA